MVKLLSLLLLINIITFLVIYTYIYSNIEANKRKVIKSLENYRDDLLNEQIEIMEDSCNKKVKKSKINREEEINKKWEKVSKVIKNVEGAS